MLGSVSQLVLTVVCICVAVKWKYLKNYIRRWYLVRKLPTYDQLALPLVGHLHLLPKTPQIFQFLADMMAKEQKKGHKITILKVGMRSQMFVHHPEAIEVLLKNSKFNEKSNIYDSLIPWLGTGLLTSKGSKWKQRRRLITPSFHVNILKDFMKVMCEHGGDLADILERKRVAGESLDLENMLQMCTLDIIIETAMGETVRAQHDASSKYSLALLEMTRMVVKRSFNPLLKSDFIFQRTTHGRRQKKLLEVLHKFSGDVIRNRMANPRKSEPGQGKKHVAFLDLILDTRTEDGKALSFEDIQEEVDTFMFAGHDTTSIALTWMFYSLGLHQDIQKKLQEEIDEVITDDQQYFNSEDLARLPYLEQVIKESLRHSPSVPGVGRVITKECEMDGYKIPKGLNATVAIYGVHHNAECWSDPHRFDPERFTKEASVGRNPFSFVPFSAGPRNCIGQKFAMIEMKVLSISVLRRFRIVSHEDDAEKTGELVLRPLHPLKISLTRR